MMAMTTSSSINVKAARDRRRSIFGAHQSSLGHEAIGQPGGVGDVPYQYQTTRFDPSLPSRSLAFFDRFSASATTRSTSSAIEHAISTIVGRFCHASAWLDRQEPAGVANGPADVGGRGIAAQVGRPGADGARPAARPRGSARPRRAGSRWSSIIATERIAASGIGDPLAGDVGRRAVDRLEHAGRGPIRDSGCPRPPAPSLPGARPPGR